MRGEEVEPPGTIAGIRQALTSDAERAEFEREVENIGADEMFGVPAKWALRTSRPTTRTRTPSWTRRGPRSTPPHV
ncbi:hypothetical protein B4N89_35975 [Embleya scabrispora]|uniref:Uncharacterized protein n=1 Tax=Embleya scabrispora TaxID=159449 RepID=A0A1T3NLT2_9ACTN|nr:hypothetical protein B4N89_35975 [Embleya scabrispora]